MTQALVDLTAAITSLTNQVPAVVAALKETSSGTPDSALTPLTAAVTQAVSEIQAALPATPSS